MPRRGRGRVETWIRFDSSLTCQHAPAENREKRPLRLHGKYLPEPDGRRPVPASSRQSQGDRGRFRRGPRGPRQPPSLHAIHVCEQEGVDIRGVRSQPLTATLIDRATHIFAMTGAHLETIHTFFPHAADKTFLLREFEEPGMTVWRDVPDPIGCSRDVYTVCAATIKNALPTVLAFVEQSELAVPAKTRGSGISSLPHGKISLNTLDSYRQLRLANRGWRRIAQRRSGNFRRDPGRRKTPAREH